MEERLTNRFDLTYVTERIITMSFAGVWSEETYRQSLRDITLMIQSKHGHNYLVRWTSAY